MIEFIASISSVFNVLSGATYLKQVYTGESTPNPATWCIWFIVTIMNTVSYFMVVQGDVWIALSSMVLALVIAIIFVLSVYKGKFTQLGRTEKISLALAVLIGLFWKLTGNAIAANVALQLIFLISFYPTLHGVLSRSAHEKATPWFLAVISYTLQILNVLLSPVGMTALIFPFVNLLGNGAIGILAVWSKNNYPKSA